MVTILTGDCRTRLDGLSEASVHAVVSSPPYWGLRDYGVDGQIGLENTLDTYVAEMVAVFREVRRVLRDDGTLWLNLGDTYAQNGGAGWQGQNGQRADRRFTATRDSVGMRECSRKPPSGLKPKDLCGVPWRVAFALQADGWYLRQDIIWHKPNTMPESITDRCTKAHEYVFLLSKSPRYYYDFEAMQEPVTGHAYARAAVKGPAGWATEGEHSAIAHNTEGVHRKTRPGGVTPKSQPSGSGVKANASFHAATTQIVTRRNRRSVWTVASEPCAEAHFATFPQALIAPCILAGCPQGGNVLDPFGGTGTTGVVAERNGRNSILIELNPEYVAIARRRTAQIGLFCAKAIA